MVICTVILCCATLVRYIYDLASFRLSFNTKKKKTIFTCLNMQTCALNNVLTCLILWLKSARITSVKAGSVSGAWHLLEKGTSNLPEKFPSYRAASLAKGVFLSPTQQVTAENLPRDPTDLRILSLVVFIRSSVTGFKSMFEQNDRIFSQLVDSNSAASMRCNVHT